MAQRKSQRRIRRSQKPAQVHLPEVVPATEAKPIRGVKLKTVSAFTMGFAVLCLLAFMAGRPDISMARNAPPGTSAQGLSSEAMRQHLERQEVFQGRRHFAESYRSHTRRRIVS
jgi:hypothetical protein